MAQIHAVQGDPDPSTRLRARVAAEIRAWRGRLNLSQAQLGEILGLSQGQVSARLLGKVAFTLDEVELLAQDGDGTGCDQ